MTETPESKRRIAEPAVAPSMSTRLQIVTSYLIVSGLLALAFALYQFLTRGGTVPSVPDVGSGTEVTMVALAAVGCLWLSAGVSLARRRKFGVVLAVAAVILQFVSAWHSPNAGGQLVFSVVALGAVVSVWSEMIA